MRQGLSAQEIAKLLDVSVGSLRVTCHRLGISLRRPSVQQYSSQSRPQMAEKGSLPTVVLTITITRGAYKQALDVPLSEETLGRLGIESAFRNVRVIELISQILCKAIEKI